jgi:threonine/homoserine/homoserine lactone efflux protein
MLVVPDVSALGLFVVASLVLLVTPGPAVLYVVARSLEQGRRVGLVSTLGIHVGTLVHVAAAALGVSALVVSSALAFSVLKYAGAAYLVYLGVRKLTSGQSALAPAGAAPRTLRQVFWQGTVVNVLNPKTAIFFLAFLPQFVDAGRGQVAAQVLVLGLVFIALALVSDGAWALAAGSAGDWLRGRAWLPRVERYVSGTVFIGLGVTAALAGNGRK